MKNNDIVQKLWSMCDILRDDGINYSDYVTELVLLLFIKMEFENTESGILKKHKLPEYARWRKLSSLSVDDVLIQYRKILLLLSESNDQIIAEIYANAHTKIKESRHLKQIIAGIDSIDWFNIKKDGLGDLYEGILEKNANETKSGAGQYFTPRPLIDSIIEVLSPNVGEVIQDPAAGTGGFLIAAASYIRAKNNQLKDSGLGKKGSLQKNAYVGMELVAETRRLALMNCLLHGLDAGDEGVVRLGNTLGSAGTLLPRADVILSNPPFGTAKGGGGATRKDLLFSTFNKQLAFLEHIYRSLKDGGRAAVVIPDNVLFEGGVGAEIRRDLMDKCQLHTILRLPTGIFYAQGVKTNVLFFNKIKDDAKNSTAKVWIYDMRSNMPKFNKRQPFSREHFLGFEEAYGKDPAGKAARVDQGLEGRFRCFDIEDLIAAGRGLDVVWLKDGSTEDAENLPEPIVLAQEAVDELELALIDLNSILSHFSEDMR
jgi:type I restriction enzyme M protein